MKNFILSTYFQFLIGFLFIAIGGCSSFQLIESASFVQEISAKPIEPNSQDIKSKRGKKKRKSCGLKKWKSPSNQNTTKSNRKGVWYMITGIILTLGLFLLAIFVLIELAFIAEVGGSAALMILLFGASVVLGVMIVGSLILFLLGVKLIKRSMAKKKHVKGVERKLYELKEVAQAYIAVENEVGEANLARKKSKIKRQIINKLRSIYEYIPNVQAKLQKLKKEKDKKNLTLEENTILDKKIAKQYQLLTKIQGIRENEEDFDILMNYLIKLDIN